MGQIRGVARKSCSQWKSDIWQDASAVGVKEDSPAPERSVCADFIPEPLQGQHRAPSATAFRCDAIRILLPAFAKGRRETGEPGCVFLRSPCSAACSMPGEPNLAPPRHFDQLREAIGALVDNNQTPTAENTSYEH